MDTLFHKAQTLFRSDKGFETRRASVLVKGGKIARVEEDGPACDRLKESFSGRIIDGRDRLLVPALFNCHTHSYMSILRNCADDLPFDKWLFGAVMPAEDRMTPGEAFTGAALAMVEMVKSGCGCFSDMHMHPDMTADAALYVGMRGVISRGLVGEDENDEGGLRRMAEALEEKKRYSGCDTLSFMLAPHAPYSCGERFLRFVAETAAKEDMGIHIHLAESDGEDRQIRERYGISPVALAARTGILSPRTVAAHCVRLDADDIALLAGSGTSVASCPSSNMKLGNGFAPVRELMTAGVNICLGTDGAASNNSLNIFRELGMITMIHKGAHKDALSVSADEALGFVTVNGARALGFVGAGVIAPGSPADLTLFRLDTPSFTPRTSLKSALCYSANGSEADTVMVGGEIIMENRTMTKADEEKLMYDARKAAARLGLCTDE